jgi:hypothetical protein
VRPYSEGAADSLHQLPRPAGQTEWLAQQHSQGHSQGNSRSMDGDRDGGTVRLCTSTTRAAVNDRTHHII